MVTLTSLNLTLQNLSRNLCLIIIKKYCVHKVTARFPCVCKKANVKGTLLPALGGGVVGGGSKGKSTPCGWGYANDLISSTCQSFSPAVRSSLVRKTTAKAVREN